MNWIYHHPETKCLLKFKNCHQKKMNHAEMGNISNTISCSIIVASKEPRTSCGPWGHKLEDVLVVSPGSPGYNDMNKITSCSSPKNGMTLPYTLVLISETVNNYFLGSCFQLTSSKQPCKQMRWISLLVQKYMETVVNFLFCAWSFSVLDLVCSQ